jgi:hypothetical protein
MINIPNLKASLLDLLHEIEGKAIKLIIEGEVGETKFMGNTWVNNDLIKKDLSVICLSP